MNFEEAIRISIREYYMGNPPVQFMEEFPDMKYTPAHFAELEAEIEAEMNGEDMGERIDGDDIEEDMADD